MEGTRRCWFYNGSARFSITLSYSIPYRGQGHTLIVIFVSFLYCCLKTELDNIQYRGNSLWSRCTHRVLHVIILSDASRIVHIREFPHFFWRGGTRQGIRFGCAPPSFLTSLPPNAWSMSSKAPCCVLRVRGVSSFHTSTPNAPPQFTVPFLPALWSGNGLYHSFFVSFSTVPFPP